MHLQAQLQLFHPSGFFCLLYYLPYIHTYPPCIDHSDKVTQTTLSKLCRPAGQFLASLVPCILSIHLTSAIYPTIFLTDHWTIRPSICHIHLSARLPNRSFCIQHTRSQLIQGPSCCGPYGFLSFWPNNKWQRAPEGWLASCCVN